MQIFITTPIGFGVRKGEKMGSGISGKYQGTRGASQPFAPFYMVMPDMHKQDILAGIVENGTYQKNPTAKDILDMIHGNYIVDP